MNDITSPKTIDNLPDEVLVEIFVYLSPKMLKVVTLVCSRWNDIVSRIPELMAHFKLNLIPGMLKLKEALKVDRRFQHLRCSLITDVQEIIDQHRLRSLELTEFTVNKTVLRNCLDGQKNLESLTIDNVEIEKESLNDVVPPAQLKKLKYIRSDNSHINILGLIGTSTLEIIIIKKFKCGLHESPENLHNRLIVLLQTQPSLKHIEVYERAADTFFNNKDICDLPCKLQTLKLGGISLHGNSKQVKSFLDKHKTTLTTLTIESPLPDEIQVFIFKHMKSIIALNARMTKKLTYLQTESGDNSAEPFPHLKYFAADNITEASFLSSLKKLESLDMTSLSDERSITWRRGEFFLRMRHLRKVLLTNVSVINSRSPKTFNDLTELHVLQLHDHNNFESFLRAHADTIEKLTIGWIEASEFSRGTLIDAIKVCSKLKFISVTSDWPLVVRSFKNITRSHPWTLEAKFKSLKRAQIQEIRVVFKFPDDDAIYKEDCRTYDDLLVREFDTVDNYGINAFANKFK